MIKVIFFDIDGTLVPMGKPHILDSTVKAFKALRSKGIHIVICTGRHITEISEGNDLSDYDFDGKDLLEVGCGRGGNLYTIHQYYKPKSAVGVDLCKANVQFCYSYQF